ncbi:MAG: hypothetical protein GY765_21935, partial [bacterium]|nr:hypothetical protein [bacterium]
KKPGGDTGDGIAQAGFLCYPIRNININEIIKNYTTKDGLADNKCNFVLKDSRGHMWLGTDNGLSCFDGKSFKTFNSKKNGLIANIWHCGMNERKGRLWFGSPHGVNSFIPPLKTNTTPPPVHITAVTVMGAEIPPGQHPRFSHAFNNFKFSFAGICLTAPEGVTYKFQLKGRDKGWLDTKERSVFYSYLPPREYTFQVKAFNNDGVESLKPAEFSFVILPPFWATWWFYTLSFLAFVLLTFFLFRFYYKRVEE